MLSHLELHNFKAFANVAIDIKPITVLLGPNNSGKSSLMSALRLLAQTLESNDKQIPLLLNGIMGDFGTYQDIVYGNDISKTIAIELALDSGLSMVLDYEYDPDNHEIILAKLVISEPGQPVKLAIRYDKTYKEYWLEVPNIEEPFQNLANSHTVTLQNFIPMTWRANRVTPQIPPSSMEGLLNDSDLIETELKNIRYIGPMRNPPARTYLFSGERRSHIGMFGENAISILSMNANTPKGIKLAQSVNTWLTKAGIATDFQVTPLTDRHYEVKVQHPTTKEYQNLADVGYGNSHVIPVLIGGYNLKAGAMYLVEQPEIHLHPRAQAELGDFFLELYQNKVATMIETHSEHLVLRLQQHVANHLIPPDDIQFYYVYAKGEQKVAQAMHLDKQGRFIEEWPEGFFPERLAEAKNLSRLRAAHAEG